MSPCDVLLTLDAGTTGLKCSLFDREGALCASSVSEYSVELPHPGWAQQPATWLIHAAIDGVSRVMEQAGDVRVMAIGLSGTMNGCIPIDANGEALYPNIIHSDVRAEPQLAQIERVISAQAYYSSGGNRLDMHYTLPKILWLRENHPDVYAKARYFVNAKDVLYGFLTGLHGRTDYSDASLTGVLSIHEGKWNESLLQALSIDPAVMPEIRPSHDVTGKLTSEAAAALSLTAGTPVSIGAGDGVCASHGAGLHAPGSAYINLGSSAWICTLSETPVIDRDMRIFNFLDMDGKRANVCGTVQCACAALDWAMENILFAGQAPCNEQFSQMEAMCAETPPGAEGVFFLPTLMGERTPWWDAAARGTIIGATLYHKRPHIARAVYEGIAQALHMCDSVMRENNLSYSELTLVGGGTQSAIWPQMLADVTGLSTQVHKQTRQATSLGAAMAAGVGIGMFASYEEASQMAHFDVPYAPDALRVADYEKHFAVYKQLYAHMQGAYAKIAKYQAE